MSRLISGNSFCNQPTFGTLYLLMYHLLSPPMPLDCLPYPQHDLSFFNYNPQLEQMVVFSLALVSFIAFSIWMPSTINAWWSMRWRQYTSFRVLWLGMITILNSFILAPISNMYVKHEVTFWENGKEVVNCVIGMISSDGSKLFTISHVVHIYYTHKILVRRAQVPLWFFRVVGFISFLSFSLVIKYLAITLALTNVDFKLDATWSMLTSLTLEPIGGGIGWLESSRGVRS